MIFSNFFFIKKILDLEILVDSVHAHHVYNETRKHTVEVNVQTTNNLVHSKCVQVNPWQLRTILDATTDLT